jgi:hypothetical protein
VGILISQWERKNEAERDKAARKETKISRPQVATIDSDSQYMSNPL